MLEIEVKGFIPYVAGCVGDAPSRRLGAADVIVAIDTTPDDLPYISHLFADLATVPF